jgi:hypothetical protein
MDTFGFSIEFTFCFFVWLFALQFVLFIPRNYQRRMLLRDSARLDFLFESVQAESEHWLTSEAELWLVECITAEDEADSVAAFNRLFGTCSELAEL